MTNAEIVNALMRSGEIDRCIRYQMRAAGVSADDRNDIRQDLCLLLLRYNGERLNAIFTGGSIGAFITRILQREFRSVRSHYHYAYRRHEQSRYALKLRAAIVNERL